MTCRSPIRTAFAQASLRFLGVGACVLFTLSPACAQGRPYHQQQAQRQQYRQQQRPDRAQGQRAINAAPRQMYGGAPAYQQNPYAAQRPQTAPAHQPAEIQRQQPAPAHQPAEIQRQQPEIPRQQPSPQRLALQPGQSGAPNRGNSNDQHLTQWMDSRRNMPVDQQQRALANEPGFSKLKPQEQQRIRDRLTQLNTMSPADRQRTLSRTEQMERLSAPQRQQIRGAMQQLGNLPDDRRHAVAKAYHQLRTLSPQQQQQALNSPAYRAQFNENERSTVNNLLTVDPMLPRDAPASPQAPR